MFALAFAYKTSLPETDVAKKCAKVYKSRSGEESMNDS
jgi:hypothetical protein